VAIVPIASLNRASLTALAYARVIADDVTAVHVATEPETGQTLQQRWREAGLTIPLVIVDSPYRELLGPLVAVIEKLHREKGGPLITVVIPEFVPVHWWERLLHTQTAWRLRRALAQFLISPSRWSRTTSGTERHRSAHQNRNWGVRQDLLGGGAHQHVAETGPAVCHHGDQVDGSGSCGFDDHLRRSSVGHEPVRPVSLSRQAISQFTEIRLWIVSDHVGLDAPGAALPDVEEQNFPPFRTEHWQESECRFGESRPIERDEDAVEHRFFDRRWKVSRDDEDRRHTTADHLSRHRAEHQPAPACPGMRGHHEEWIRYLGRKPRQDQGRITFFHEDAGGTTTREGPCDFLEVAAALGSPVFEQRAQQFLLLQRA
jgi:hypothetical protein